MAVLMNTLGERSLANDLHMGLTNEDKYQSIFNTAFSDTFINTKEKYNDPYCKWDYESEGTNTRIEMKSRRNRYSAYPTTIIPVNKVLNNFDGRHILCFAFTDGLYYIDYNAEKFSQYQITDITTYRKGIVDRPKPHYLIDIRDLTKI